MQRKTEYATSGHPNRNRTLRPGPDALRCKEFYAVTRLRRCGGDLAA